MMLQTDDLTDCAVSDEAAAYIADALMELALKFEATHLTQIRRHHSYGFWLPSPISLCALKPPMPGPLAGADQPPQLDAYANQL